MAYSVNLIYRFYYYYYYIAWEHIKAIYYSGACVYILCLIDRTKSLLKGFSELFQLQSKGWLYLLQKISIGTVNLCTRDSLSIPNEINRTKTASDRAAAVNCRKLINKVATCGLVGLLICVLLVSVKISMYQSLSEPELIGPPFSSDSSGLTRGSSSSSSSRVSRAGRNGSVIPQTDWFCNSSSTNSSIYVSEYPATKSQ